MEKFKFTKFFKENFKTIILIFFSALVIGGTTAFASYNYFAKNVEYTKKDGTKISVNDALNELYKNNANRLYLYWYGDTCDSVTGGWGNTVKMTLWAYDHKNISVNNISPKFEKNYMDFMPTSTYECISSNTINKIDCSLYNYVNILYSMSSNYASCFRFSTDNSIENYALPQNNARSIIIHNDLMMTSYPINNFQDGYFAINTLRGYSGDVTTNLKIYGVFLSKKL